MTATKMAAWESAIDASGIHGSSMKTRSRVDQEALLLKAIVEVDSYREFLRHAIHARARDGLQRPNMAALSRKAGFSSRSFIGEVIDGRRRLSARSYAKLVGALGLTAKLKVFFNLLVIREEPELNFDGLDATEVARRLSDVRAKILSEAGGKRSEKKAIEAVLNGRHLMACYAALGDPSKGSTIAEIAARTELPEASLRDLLSSLVKSEAVVEKAGRYFAASPLIFHKDLGSEAAARECYLDALGELKRKSQARFSGQDRAFFQFLFSVDRNRLPELKQKLWETAREFVENHDSSEGDSIAKFVIGFYV